MILSRILMILALAVLAYLVYMIMTDGGAEKFSNKETKKVKNAESMGCSVNPQPSVIPQVTSLPVEEKTEQFVATPEKIVYDSTPEQKIKYEAFADVGGIADNVYGAAPFGSKAVMDEGDMAKVNYTGLVDGTPGDVIQIEGTDLLTAPLIDNMLYTNSIANTNRNASQDLRGDIPLQFNDTYTPFYSSVIYGAPLSQKQMTIGNI